MSDFFRSSPSNKPGIPPLFPVSFGNAKGSYVGMAAQKEAVVNAIRAEINLATAQELIAKTSEKCFAKCVPKPGMSLTSSEETCLTRCMDRYLEA
ncbi:Tim10/DDP family zinc finger-domain-containing protein, partial [Lanmaoa asiatica]